MAPPTSTTATPAPRRAPPKRAAVSRRRLSHAQKLELCEFSFANRHMDLLELAIWAANHFRIGLPPGERTIGRILSNYNELRKMTPELLQYKSTPSESLRRLDAQLRDWIRALAEQGLRVDGAMIKREAARVYAQLHENSTEAQRPPSFSNGWLCSFLERNGISLRSYQTGGSPFVADAKKKKTKTKKATTTRRAPASRRSTVVATATATSPSADE